MLKHIDTTMTEVYWYVGKITYELSNNSTKASYRKQIINALSSRLLPSKEELIKIIKDEKELIELAQNNEKETNL